MVYLIDEKVLRQSNYGWNERKFEEYSEVLKKISNKEQLDNVKSEIFDSSESIILFHDSFVDDPKNRHKKESDEIRQDLLKDEHSVVTFSGSKANRYIEKKYASMHVGWVYKNLEFFLDKIKENDVKLEYLAYGNNYKYEKIANIRYEIWDYLYSISNENSYLNLKNKQEDDLRELLTLLKKEDYYPELANSKITVGYFKYQLNKLITENFYEQFSD